MIPDLSPDLTPALILREACATALFAALAYAMVWLPLSI